MTMGVRLAELLLVSIVAVLVAGDEPPLQQSWALSDLFHTSKGRAGTAAAAKTGAEGFFRTTYQRQLLVGRSATGLLPSKQLQSIARTLSQVDAICDAVDRTTSFSQNVLKVCLCVCVPVCVCACARACVCVCF